MTEISGDMTVFSEKLAGTFPDKRYQITKENAKELAARSVASRSAKRELAAQHARMLAELTSPAPLNEKQNRVEAQLNRLDKLIDIAIDGKEIGLLIQSKERLLNAWALLTGFPRPGVRRQTKQSRTAPDPQPVVSAPEPVQSVPEHNPQEPNG